MPHVTCDILDLDIGEDPSACWVTRQMSLPHRCGGLGVLTHTEMTSRAAYLSAAALTEKSVQKGDPAFLPFSGPSGHMMQDTYAVLQSMDGELPALSPEAVADAIPGLQTLVRRAHDVAMLQSLKAVFQEHSNSKSTVERIRGERNLARMHSVRQWCIQVHGRNALLHFLADE